MLVSTDAPLASIHRLSSKHGDSMPRAHCAFAAVLALTILLANIAGRGQGNAEELNALRTHLGLPDGATIALAPSSQIEKLGSLKVYLAFRLDTGVRNNFLNWIDGWNRRDGKRRGLLEIVPELGQADVILARYVALDKVTTQTDGVLVGTGSGDLIGRSGSYQEVPAYSYVLVPASAASIGIVWRYRMPASTVRAVDL
jgi:hypothetical protein